MDQLLPQPVARYLGALNRLSDPILDDIAREGSRQELPIIGAEVGALLQVLAGCVGAQRILEIGTGIGYSGIWLARALPADGMLITFEVDRDRAAIARANFSRAGVADRANVMIGDAARLLAKVSGPFDLIFQDGDKQQYPSLLDALVERLRPGGLLVTDNVLWNGEVIPGYVERPTQQPDDTRAIAQFNERLAADARLWTTFLPLRDGVAVSHKHR